jgi:hypothetical protein
MLQSAGINDPEGPEKYNRTEVMVTDYLTVNRDLIWFSTLLV